jgi:hypothetical protein
MMSRPGDLNGEFVYNGIDRLDCAIGYQPNNVVSCCAICNRAKGDMPFEAFIEWIIVIASRLQQKAKAITEAV